MKSINSRKGQTSITHLMNFSLPPRPQYNTYSGSHTHRHQRRNLTWGLGSGYHHIDKARYVHANYRFIVRPDGDYRTQAIDSDVHLDWNNVLQVLASAETQLASCPICLSTPVAPRMAKCGHMFCFPCLIRYMHSTDDLNPVPEKRARWKKCPICEDSIYISETRPVRWFAGQEASLLREGGDVLLRLLKREPASTLALPRDTADVVALSEDVPWFHVAEVMDYARVMKGGEDYMTSQYDQEIEVLAEQEREDELMFGEDPTWTRKAKASINEAKERIKGIGNPPPTAHEEIQSRKQKAPIKFEEPEDGVPYMHPIQQASKSGRSLTESSETRPTVTNEGSASPTISKNSQITEALKSISINDPSYLPQVDATRATKVAQQRYISGRPHGSPFYFYQALPNFYLSPLDIRILRAAFGEFASFPTTILPRIEHISTGHVVDDELRKRAKYLSHLPYGCEVSFLECDWTGSVNAEVLTQFSADIERRRKRNYEKEAREEKERQRAEKEEEDKRYAAARRRRPSIAEKSFSETDFQPLIPPMSGSPSEINTMSASPPWQNNRAESAFATLATPGTSPDAPRTVWGTAAVASSSPTLHAAVDPVPPVGDGWLQGWEKDLLDHDDAVAIVEASLAAEGSSGGAKPSPGTAGNGGGKKKKNKKITLMSTGGARRGA